MPSFVIKTNPRGPQRKPLVVVIGTRVSKKATERNLLRRRIKAIMQPIVRKLERDFVVIVKPGAERLTYQELKNEIEKKLVINN